MKTEEKITGKSTIILTFDDYDVAFDYMARRNMIRKKIKGHPPLCLVYGPEDNQYSVVDEKTATEFDTYVWALSTTSYVVNPWLKIKAA